ncbi:MULTISPECIES: GNAT family N-acetyltransferase [unclassified Microbacterium]|uniref:GNAT family N-acetyltransferase n=1 Tax=unclassified Microbacterium TaxID=2609290 RepID=UPI000EA8E6D3|nr:MULTISPECIES: GNAT family N-acetyltransferase [unclassified Microbacterium]MBT2483743.1 GNAT family N-acetyltransferase [Microbacterium sp. ISL-108]RKN66735.1 GNAT family N-acetyltransferase [Microbacterium sp. CGR2]
MRTIRDLDTVELIIDAQGLLDSIRGPQRVVDAGTLRALQQSGNYVVGLFDGEGGDEHMVGASIAFFGEPGRRAMHSHITALLPEYRGRGWGRELKEHQRQWAFSRDVGRITWTFDPLVARNAHFFLSVLGARVTGYSVNRYGIFGGGDAGDESDRLDVEWALADIAKAPADEAVAETLEIPADIEALRGSDPAAAHEWRTRLRAQMEGLLARGLQITGFDVARGYLFSAPRA